MRKNIFGFLLIASFAVNAAFGQAVAPALKISSDERKTVEGVTAKQMSDYLHFVASDAMEGRDTPSRGLDTVAEFIKMNLSKWGFKPAGDNGTYFQKIALVSETADPTLTKVSIDGQAFTFGDDIPRLAGNRASAGAIDPIRRRSSLSETAGWSSRRILIPTPGSTSRASLSRSTPRDSRRTVTRCQCLKALRRRTLAGTRGTDWADPMTYTQAHGAAGVLILPSKFMGGNWVMVKQMFGRRRLAVDKFRRSPTGTPDPNVFAVSPKFASVLFAGAQGDPMTGYTTPFTVNKNVNITVVQKAETQWTQNVVAIWEGSDPVLKNEMVAIGAHYDHVGMNPNVPGPDKIFNGADDDGSGTVARALDRRGPRTRTEAAETFHSFCLALRRGEGAVGQRIFQ